MVVALFLMAAAQTAPGVAEPDQICSLATPRSEAIEFALVAAGEGGARLEPSGTASWPSASVAGVRRGRGSDQRYALSGPDRLVLEVVGPSGGRQQREATIFRRESGNDLPVAYGFCRPGSAAPAAAASAGDNAIFDLNRWSNGECGIVLGDGRHARLRVGGGEGEISFASPILWQGRIVMSDDRRTRDRAPFISEFGRRRGPAGVRTTFVALPRASVDTIRFENLADSRAPDLSGYAICGFTTFIRRSVHS